MEDQITEPPWYSDIGGMIYAPNGRPGQTTVAALLDGAPAELLAAAPDLLQAVKDSDEFLIQELSTLPPGARHQAVLHAKTFADTAMARARVGYPAALKPERLWTVDAALPTPEAKANARLLDAASDLY
jgi:hypothetical protein